MKNSRPFNSNLRWLMAAGSVGAFLGGWVLLAHSPNPYGNDAVQSENTSATQQNQLPTRTPRNNNSVSPRTLPTPVPLPQDDPNLQPEQQQPNLQRLPNTQRLPSRSSRGQFRLRTGGS